MVFEAPPTQYHQAQILTGSFQYGGQIESVGPIFEYINNTNRHSLSLHDVHLAPLTPGSPMKGLSRPHVIVRRNRVVFIYFAEKETRDNIRVLKRTETLVAYTSVAVCRGHFHMAQEANLGDFLDATQEALIPVSDATVFPLIEYPAPFPQQLDRVLIGRDQILSYHPT